MSVAPSVQVLERKGFPWLIYGTAWKKDQTANLVKMAVETGFSAFDTANFPKHYNEEGVGEGLREFLKTEGARETIFIQTKFTRSAWKDQTDETRPYDPDLSLEEQILQSFQGSLEHLGVDYLDSYILHSPYPDPEDTLKAWRVFESLVEQGKVKYLGISNVNPLQLHLLQKHVQVPISFVQNRLRLKFNFDRGTRKFCEKHDICYQSFWTITTKTNRKIMKLKKVKDIAISRQVSKEEIFYKYIQQTRGVAILDGTTNKSHMQADLRLRDFWLDQSELSQMHRTIAENVEKNQYKSEENEIEAHLINEREKEVFVTYVEKTSKRKKKLTLKPQEYKSIRSHNGQVFIVKQYDYMIHEFTVTWDQHGNHALLIC
eukprot:augustus_masked-scaffold_12-processed-gene-8.2-mRNA-1 protein AED:0.13 eAED:0.13 QI:0/-1/0/1/-1/1/1/0/373